MVIWAFIETAGVVSGTEGGVEKYLGKRMTGRGAWLDAPHALLLHKHGVTHSIATQETVALSSQARTLPLMHVTSTNTPPGPINSIWGGRDEISMVHDDTSFGPREPAQMEIGGEASGWVPPRETTSPGAGQAPASRASLCGLTSESEDQMAWFNVAEVMGWINE